MFKIILVLMAIHTQTGDPVQRTLISGEEWATEEACMEVLESPYNKGIVRGLVAQINPYEYHMKSVVNKCVQTDLLTQS